MRSHLLIGLLPNPADRINSNGVPLIWRHLLDATVAIVVVVPVDQAIYPSTHRQQIPGSGAVDSSDDVSWS